MKLMLAVFGGAFGIAMIDSLIGFEHQQLWKFVIHQFLTMGYGTILYVIQEKNS